MNTQDLQKLREKILASTLISQIEKTEWMQLLPEMSDAQAFELESILRSAQENAQAAIKPVVHKPEPQKDLPAAPVQKDLPAGAQISALEHVIMHDLPAHLAPLAKPVPAPAPAHSAPTPAAPVHKMQTPEDLTSLSVGFLRQGDPQLVLTNLLHAIVDMTKKYTVTNLVGKIEESPLYKAYYNTGYAALNSGALASASAHPETLTKDEFEAFTDFRRSMEQILS